MKDETPRLMSVYELAEEIAFRAEKLADKVCDKGYDSKCGLRDQLNKILSSIQTTLDSL